MFIKTAFFNLKTKKALYIYIFFIICFLFYIIFYNNNNNKKKTFQLFALQFYNIIIIVTINAYLDLHCKIEIRRLHVG